MPSSMVIANKRQLYDLNKNGRIEISELYFGIKRQVVQLVDWISKEYPEDKNGPQTPWLARDQMVGAFTPF